MTRLSPDLQLFPAQVPDMEVKEPFWTHYNEELPRRHIIEKNWGPRHMAQVELSLPPSTILGTPGVPKWLLFYASKFWGGLLYNNK